MFECGDQKMDSWVAAKKEISFKISVFPPAFRNKSRSWAMRTDHRNQEILPKEDGALLFP